MLPRPSQKTKVFVYSKPAAPARVDDNRDVLLPARTRADLSPDGTQRLVEKDAGSLGDAEAIGKLVAQKLRERGATALLERESRGTRA